MSHRKNKAVGLAAFDRSRLTSAQYATHGSALRSSQASALETQLSVFRSLLQQFAATHAKDIKSNPTFRAQFARMCAAIGVDPLLASSHESSKGGKGQGGGDSMWAQLLGRTGLNDFYFELAVRVVEVCGETRGENGGLIEVGMVRERVVRGRVEGMGVQGVTEDDILRAVGTLKPLGSAYSVIKVGSKQYIRSVPKELNTDQSAVLEAAQVLGYVSVSMLMDNLRWTRARAQTALEDLVGEGMLWVDKQGIEWEYWSPGFMLEGDHPLEGFD
ncbi:EAP30/Vps36 family-domain-containing protein [Copromyces sp. CBS 386.78]|uniref:Vacuolar-sorting protein SNF8 n=1 Tax=Pseudoneurospora amorphoporcata TaxID=241081 RepID=A0AAN6P379_9PEZI|nr:EAP30/Vps36 family-domain-containing protein [Copromyces sp. CBS 386.78]KAK3956917.1 EAP30/Vps36 family-domain-containing protein [Pseudoneurospora amorphoporcata]